MGCLYTNKFFEINMLSFEAPDYIGYRINLLLHCLSVRVVKELDLSSTGLMVRAGSNPVSDIPQPSYSMVNGL